MITLTIAQKAVLDSGALCLCTLYVITRTDGVILRFTDHDQEILFSSNIYYPGVGFNASAAQKQSGMRSRNRDALGVITSDSITNDDLRAGRYRDAKVEELLVAWDDLALGAFYTNTYWIDEVTFSVEEWQGTLAGITTWLEKEIGSYYTRDCRFVLGDAQCGKNLASFTFTGAVTAVTTSRTRFQSGLANADGYFNYGKLTWTGGANLNLVADVKTYLNASGDVALWLALPFDIVIGDTFVIVAGCDKLFTTCKTKFSNGVRFGGFPYIPGGDVARATPDGKS